MKRLILTLLLCLCVVAVREITIQKTYVSEEGAENEKTPVSSGVSVERREKRKKLISRHITASEFKTSIENAREYEADGVIAGVIPHHTTAATLIGGLFKSVAGGSYDTVIVIAPNHDGDIADIVVSRKDWDIGNGMSCDTDIIGHLLAGGVRGATIAENDKRMEDDHSASVLMPYINHYLSNGKVAPILVSRMLTLDGTINLADTLTEIIKESGKKILLVCSVDFSHFLTPEQAKQRDSVTSAAIENKNYKQIHDFSNEYLDSPASLIVFLRYLDNLGISAQILDNTDASEFLGTGVLDTTSYFVIVGREAADE